MAAHSVMVVGRARSLVMALLLVAGVAGQDLSRMHGSCETLLGSIARSAYNNIELAALCRARAPAEICRETLSGLGEKRWAPEGIAATCDGWQRDFQMRTLEQTPAQQRQMLEDLQASVEGITSKKTALGVCRDQTVDQCVSTKKEAYPKYNRKLADAIQLKYEVKSEQYTAASIPADSTRGFPPMSRSTTTGEVAQVDTASTTTGDAGQDNETVTTAGNGGNPENLTVTSAATEANAPTTVVENQSVDFEQKASVVSDITLPSTAPSRSLLLLFGLPALLFSLAVSVANTVRAKRAASDVYSRAVLPDDEECFPVRGCSAAQ